MNKKHFIKNFMEQVPVEEPLNEEGKFKFDVNLQLLIKEGKEPFFEMAWYTNSYTSSKYIKGHRSRNNKWIPGRTRPGKTDRRSGK
jgi:hypothetical protein